MKKFENYPAFCRWVSAHWHMSQALDEAQTIISPFFRAAVRQGVSYSSAWRSRGWTIPAQRAEIQRGEAQGLQSEALRWLDSAEEAEELIQACINTQVLDLSGLLTLTAEAAQVLARFKGTLNLSGLTRLEPAAAQALASFGGLILLDGLTQLDAAIIPLCQRQLPSGAVQPGLSLRGVKTLSLEQAGFIALVQGDLDLSGLEQVSPQLAAALAKRHGESNLELGWLRLNGWRSATAESVVALAPYKGPLSLPTADKAILSILVNQQRYALALPSVTQLDDTLPELLASLPIKELHLPSLVLLERAAAVLLANAEHPFDLYLDGLTTLSVEAASALCQQNNYGTGVYMANLSLNDKLRRILKGHDLATVPNLHDE